MSKIEEITNKATTVGNITINGDNNPVVIGSGSIEIIHGKKLSDPELAKALTIVVGHLEDTENQQAAVFLDKFTEQLNKPEPDKTLLNALWSSVVSAAPTLKSLADVTTAITKLFT